MTCSGNSFVAHNGIGECSEIACLEVGIKVYYQPWNSPGESCGTRSSVLEPSGSG